MCMMALKLNKSSMKEEIYKLIREFCISDTCAESAAEKVVEYLESKKRIGIIAPDIIKELERLKGPVKVVVVNSPPPPLLEKVRPEIFNVK